MHAPFAADFVDCYEYTAASQILSQHANRTSSVPIAHRAQLLLTEFHTLARHHTLDTREAAHAQ